MARICTDCIYNNDGVCFKTYEDDLDSVKNCFEKIKDFELSFYYNEESNEYRVVAYLGSNGEILKQKKISSDKLLKMLKRENENTNDSLINKIVNNNEGAI